MGFFKSVTKPFKSVAKVVKKVAAMPFETVRDTWRGVEALGQGVGQLSRGDIGGAFESTVAATGQAIKAAANAATVGGVSDNGYLIDTKVKQETIEDITASETEDAAVSFAEAGTPSVVVGADEVEEDVIKRKKSSRQAGFLGGVESSGSSILIG